MVLPTFQQQKWTVSTKDGCLGRSWTIYIVSTRLLYALFVCLFVCASTLIACAIIISHTLLPCDYTLVKLASLTAALSTGVATLSSLAQLRIWSRGNIGRDDARLTKSGNSRSKQLHVSSAEQLADWEWLSGEPLNGLNVQRPSFFFHTCFPSLIAGAHDFAFTLPCAPAGNICSDLAHSACIPL